MGFRDRDGAAEGITDFDFVIAFAGNYRHASHA
jgi:hypothetical protein